MTDGRAKVGGDAAASDASGGVDAFRALVLADAAYHARLGGIVYPDVFIAQAMALATERGIRLEEAALRAATRPDPLDIGRAMAAPITLDRWPARGWLPVCSVPTGAAPGFDWAWFGTDRLDMPFYEESVRHMATRPFSLMFRTRTSLRTIVDGVDPDDAAPAGFVYHMSRCGSTLVARMLAADPAHLVLSEPEPLDAVVRWALESGAPLGEQVAALRAVTAALGNGRTDGTSRVFFKLDCWHAIALPLFRAAFPDTPWVYLCRNPIEILVSQIRRRALHTVAGLLPACFIDIDGAETMAAERYIALVLARTGQSILDHWDGGGGLIVDYDDMPAAVQRRILPHFGLVPTGAGEAAMAAASTRDAKSPDRPFVPDAAGKRSEATLAVRIAAREIAGPVYDRLAALRPA